MPCCESMRRQRVTYSAGGSRRQKGDRVVVDFARPARRRGLRGRRRARTCPWCIGCGPRHRRFRERPDRHEQGRDEDRAGEVPRQLRRARNWPARTPNSTSRCKAVEERSAAGGGRGLRRRPSASPKAAWRRCATKCARAWSARPREAVRTKLRTPGVRGPAARQPDRTAEVAGRTSRSSSCRSTCCSAWAATDASQMPPREPFEEPARRRVMLGLLIGELVRREKLQGRPRDASSPASTKLAASLPESGRSARAPTCRTRTRCARSRPPCIEDQAVDWVVAQAHVTDRPTSFAELTGFAAGVARSVESPAMNERALNLVPMVVEQTSRGERAYDIYSRLLKDRVVFAWVLSRTTWRMSSSPSCCSWSPRTRTRTSRCTSIRRAATSRRAWPSTTPCSSSSPMSRRSASARPPAWVRCCWPAAPRASASRCRDSRIMIHQPLGGMQGQAADMEIHAREILYTRDRLNEILARHTGQPVEKIKHDTDRDNFMRARGCGALRPDRPGAVESRDRSTQPGRSRQSPLRRCGAFPHKLQGLNCDALLCAPRQPHAI